MYKLQDWFYASCVQVMQTGKGGGWTPSARNRFCNLHKPGLAFMQVAQKWDGRLRNLCASGADNISTVMGVMQLTLLHNLYTAFA